jgi:hypothetical protein
MPRAYEVPPVNFLPRLSRLATVNSGLEPSPLSKGICLQGGNDEISTCGDESASSKSEVLTCQQCSVLSDDGPHPKQQALVKEGTQAAISLYSMG